MAGCDCDVVVDRAVVVVVVVAAGSTAAVSLVRMEATTIIQLFGEVDVVVLCAMEVRGCWMWAAGSYCIVISYHRRRRPAQVQQCTHPDSNSTQYTQPLSH